MAEASFSSILDRPASEVNRPPTLPVGHYVAVIQGLPRRDKSTKKGTEYVEFTCKVQSALDDVDEKDLKTYQSVSGPVSDAVMKLTFYMTEKSAYRLKDFVLDDLQLEIPDNMDLWSACQETGGAQFTLQIAHKPTQDGKGVFAEIASTGPVA